MILTKTTEYAVRILTFMAKENKQLYSAKHLNEKLNIPYKYLTKLMTDLARKGLLTSIKGRDGGFRLSKKSNKITLSEIVESVEGLDSFNSCVLGFHECSNSNPCAMHFVWEENKKNLLETLQNTTIKNLTNQYITKH